MQRVLGDPLPLKDKDVDEEIKKPHQKTTEAVIMVIPISKHI